MKGLKSRYNRTIKGLRKGRKGFTLIELLIVIAILGVLAAVVIPNISRFTKSGSIAAAKAEKQEIQISVDAVMADNGVASVDAVTLSSTALTLTGTGITDGDVGAFMKRTSGIKGTYAVATDGFVTCATYPGLETADIAKVNGS